MLNTLRDIVRKSSIHVCLINSGGCNGCDIEVVALLSPRYDLEQYGIYVHNNPREADVILITGAVTEQWVKNIQRIYTKVPEPKVVVCIGNCPLSGDVFNQEGGNVYAPVSDFIPVDAEISGCPPRPNEILEAILAVAPGAIAAKGREVSGNNMEVSANEMETSDSGIEISNNGIEVSDKKTKEEGK